MEKIKKDIQSSDFIHIEHTDELNCNGQLPYSLIQNSITNLAKWYQQNGIHFCNVIIDDFNQIQNKSNHYTQINHSAIINNNLSKPYANNINDLYINNLENDVIFKKNHINTISKTSNIEQDFSQNMQKNIDCNEQNISKITMHSNIQQKSDLLATLKSDMLQIECDLKNTATNLVFSDGNQDADIMIIGEAPGEDEDIQSKPFVGKSGQLLRTALRNIGVSQDNIYITNVIPFRPPYNRQPTDEEIKIYENSLKKHINIVQPKILFLVGSVATKAVMLTNVLTTKNTHQQISKLRGKPFLYRNNYFEEKSHNIVTIPTFHPSYLLRSPDKKAEYVKDIYLMQYLLKNVKKK